MTVKHEFVEFIPETVEPNTVYISIPHRTAIHSCLCGCGVEVVTPLSPTDWRLIFDGETVSLYPSIGNWSFPCRSHYWIEKSRAVWAKVWTKEQILAGRKRDQLRRDEYYSSKQQSIDEAGIIKTKVVKTTTIDRLLLWLFG